MAFLDYFILLLFFLGSLDFLLVLCFQQLYLPDNCLGITPILGILKSPSLESFFYSLYYQTSTTNSLTFANNTLFSPYLKHHYCQQFSKTSKLINKLAFWFFLGWTVIFLSIKSQRVFSESAVLPLVRLHATIQIKSMKILKPLIP